MECIRYLFFLGSALCVLASQECQETADIIFLVDSSWSIRESNPANTSVDHWQLIKEFMRNIVDELPVENGDVRIGVLKFSTNVDEGRDEIIYLNSHGPNDKERLVEKISKLKFYPGNTNTSGALRTLHQVMIEGYHGSRAEVRKIAVLITDGLSNVDSNKTIPEAREAKKKGIRIFTIGITKYADGSELEEIASDPVDYHYILVRDFSNLALLVDQLLGRICLAKPPPPMPCKDARADIVFLLDNSGSIEEKNPQGTGPFYNWNLLKDFVVEIVQNLQVGFYGTRVAVIRFSTIAEVMFHLNTYYEGYEVIRAVKDLSFNWGGTNTSGALRTMREIVFSPPNGDRAGVRNIGIIITDGESTTDRNLTFPEAMKTHHAEIKMFAIGLTDFIGEKELRAIASEPTQDYFFNTTKISYVETLVSRLVWGVCNSQCQDLSKDEQIKSELCSKLNETACPEGKYKWIQYKGHLLIGHNYARIQHVSSAGECQRICLKDPYCRSIDYVWGVNECAVSYVSKTDTPESFAKDSGSDYYELDCEVEYGNGIDVDFKDDDEIEFPGNGAAKGNEGDGNNGGNGGNGGDGLNVTVTEMDTPRSRGKPDGRGTGNKSSSNNAIKNSIFIEHILLPVLMALLM